MTIRIGMSNAWRTACIALLSGVLSVNAVAAATADVPYSVTIDGRPLDATRTTAVVRRGVTYIDVVRAVKAFDGLLTYGQGGTLVATILGRTMSFRTGAAVAMLDGAPLPLAGAPFVVDGDTFVPLAPIAKLAMAKVVVRSQRHRVSLYTGRGDGFAVVPSPTPSGTAGADQLETPAIALKFVTVASVDANGTLHARLDITNTLGDPYVLHFVSKNHVTFIVARNGSEVWSSPVDASDDSPSDVTVAAHATVNVSRDWAGYGHAGPGRYTLRARLLTLAPSDITPISLDVTPSPTPSTR